ncbi:MULTISPECIES: hypothetical protein [Rhodanobacter]|uniref:Uncharacterized protein n=1 Tax=Rhodanobacter hydrolyticus TaxID=2250595 RepID=A0ABW8J641_9GAMM|nr:hypothetical protein [Rhodanobacter sp. 7MK24]MBD8879888.1 hypothetical protein [Rhodanobacter sp. 7MK24]
MKLLRDFFRLRTPRRSLSVARRDARRRVYVVTVPAPLTTPAAEPQRKAEARASAPLSSPRHLQLAH